VEERPFRAASGDVLKGASGPVVARQSPQGLKPFFQGSIYAALMKRGSSTVLDAAQNGSAEFARLT